MAELTVTARGQVTFRKEVLRHLGVKPGQKIELELVPGGNGIISAARKTGSIEDFIGVLDGKSRKSAAIGDIGKATERSWAGMR
ncbi:MAG TPA: AbrB/MazE/SpoVT family DNA-binding domain-containing protein [Terracidiphilus sp.]|jgi:bifunctional DNA-binding transcriptional regulator/antitoxin component of YhaV-PrlF toxin-antitoxin module